VGSPCGETPTPGRSGSASTTAGVGRGSPQFVVFLGRRFSTGSVAAGGRSPYTASPGRRSSGPEWTPISTARPPNRGCPSGGPGLFKRSTVAWPGSQQPSVVFTPDRSRETDWRGPGLKARAPIRRGGDRPPRLARGPSACVPGRRHRLEPTPVLDRNFEGENYCYRLDGRVDGGPARRGRRQGPALIRTKTARLSPRTPRPARQRPGRGGLAERSGNRRNCSPWPKKTHSLRIRVVPHKERAGRRVHGTTRILDEGPTIAEIGRQPSASLIDRGGQPPKLLLELLPPSTQPEQRPRLGMLIKRQTSASARRTGNLRPSPTSSRRSSRSSSSRSSTSSSRSLPTPGGGDGRVFIQPVGVGGERGRAPGPLRDGEGQRHVALDRFLHKFPGPPALGPEFAWAMPRPNRRKGGGAPQQGRRDHP